MTEVKCVDLSNVLTDAIKKFKEGEEEHGPLYLVGDPRNFLYEMERELLDAIVYASLEVLRIRKLREKRASMDISSE